MSNSFRKTPIIGITKAPSEKADKRRANKAHRANQKKSELPVDRRESSDTWLMAKDGKCYYRELDPKLLRK
jgi:hypothetical protein